MKNGNGGKRRKPELRCLCVSLRPRETQKVSSTGDDKKRCEERLESEEGTGPEVAGLPFDADKDCPA